MSHSSLKGFVNDGMEVRRECISKPAAKDPPTPSSFPVAKSRTRSRFTRSNPSQVARSAVPLAAVMAMVASTIGAIASSWAPFVKRRQAA